MVIFRLIAKEHDEMLEIAKTLESDIRDRILCASRYVQKCEIGEIFESSIRDSIRPAAAMQVKRCEMAEIGEGIFADVCSTNHCQVESCDVGKRVE